MNTNKKKYIVLEFDISNIEYMLKILNDKGSEGYKIINTHYYSKSPYAENVRFILELEY